MTIKEVEELTGMTRANIRFYETEGMIHPARNRNSYREYTEQDVETLQKIKLLRTLHLSLEEIKELASGEKMLGMVLDRHMQQLDQERADLDEARRICGLMRSDGVKFDNLDAKRYLEAFGKTDVGEESTCREGQEESLCRELQEDRMVKVQAPWRRYFARSFDLMLYHGIWELILGFVFSVNIKNMGTFASLMNGFVGIVLMFLLEPVWLTLTGTTPGKWLLGMHITDTGGNKLKYQAAVSRTGSVIWYGLGLGLPGYHLYRKWRSYQICRNERMQEWEYENVIHLKDERPLRTAGFVVLYAVVPFLFSWLQLWAGMPKHRGDLTIQEFSENYNHIARYHDLGGSGLTSGGKLTGEGAWKEAPAGVIYINGFVPEPEIEFTEENGYITGLAFSGFLKNSASWPRDYRQKMILCVRAFVQARKECGLFSGEMEEVLNYISEHPFEDFSLEAYGVKITCDVEYTGYNETFRDVMGSLIPVDDDVVYDNEYRLEFRMELE